MMRTAGFTLTIIWLLAACHPQPDHWQSKSISGLLPDLAFELTDENHKTVTEADYRGELKLVFFGFSHCGHACPMTLHRLGRAVEALPESRQDAVTVLFISVDPGRDDPRRLKNYTANFGEPIVGLTGTQEQLRRLHKRMRITYGYGKPGPEGHYDVSHSSAVYLFDRAGQARRLIKADAGQALFRTLLSERLPPDPG